jgi:hypothetical protein
VFTYPYGISFNFATPQAYTLFADVNSNNKFDVSGGDIAVESFSLRSPYKIIKLRTINGTVETDRTPIDITFTRPNPDASVMYGGTTKTTDSVVIYLGTTQDATASSTITIRSTGQISVN